MQNTPRLEDEPWFCDRHFNLARMRGGEGEGLILSFALCSHSELCHWRGCEKWRGSTYAHQRILGHVPRRLCLVPLGGEAAHIQEAKGCCFVGAPSFEERFETGDGVFMTDLKYLVPWE